jgi:hypothetical protein
VLHIALTVVAKHIPRFQGLQYRQCLTCLPAFRKYQLLPFPQIKNYLLTGRQWQIAVTAALCLCPTRSQKEKTITYTQDSNHEIERHGVLL